MHAQADADEDKLCSASQDIVFLIDVSYSRKSEQDEYRSFLRNFTAQFGLDGGAAGPRMGIAAFHGSVSNDWTSEQSTRVLTDLTASR